MGTKTGMTAQQDVFNRLVKSGVKQAVSLTGKIYPYSRPKDSQVEDITLNTLAINADQVQEGVFNVNIHVPNLMLTDDLTQPNISRFEVITAAVVEALSNYHGFDYHFDLDAPGVLERDGMNWFSNIRVKYYSLRN